MRKAESPVGARSETATASTAEPGGPVRNQVEHPVHLLRRPLDLGLHAAVEPVARPAGHPEALRGLPSAPTEADALHATGHDRSSADHTPIVLLVLRGGCGPARPFACRSCLNGGMSEPADRIPDLRSDLIAAGLTVDALTELWGEEAADALHRGQRIPAERALAQRRTLGPDDAGAAVRAVPPGPARPSGRGAPALGIDGAESLGLVTVGDDTVSAGGRPPALRLRGCGRARRVVDRLRPRRARPRPRAPRGSRARRRRRIPHPERTDAADAGRERARPRDRMRHPGDARRPPRPARRRHRHLRRARSDSPP